MLKNNKTAEVGSGNTEDKDSSDADVSDSNKTKIIQSNM